MGLGDMSRRLGMNQSSVSRAKTLNEAMGDHPNQALNDAEAKAEKRSEKRDRIEGGIVGPANITNLTEDINQLVADFADVEAQLAVLNARRAELKALATKMSLEHGVDDFVGPQGKVQVIVTKARETFNKKKARQYLTEAQYQSCIKLGKDPEPTVKFVPAGK
jgi:hypothetical protein